MASGKLFDDPLEVTQREYAAERPFEYSQFIAKYQHPEPCRVPVGITCGNDVSVFSGVRPVDIESTLRGLRDSHVSLDGRKSHLSECSRTFTTAVVAPAGGAPFG